MLRSGTYAEDEGDEYEDAGAIYSDNVREISVVRHGEAHYVDVGEQRSAGHS